MVIFRNFYPFLVIKKKEEIFDNFFKKQIAKWKISIKKSAGWCTTNLRWVQYSYPYLQHG